MKCGYLVSTLNLRVIITSLKLNRIHFNLLHSILRIFYDIVGAIRETHGYSICSIPAIFNNHPILGSVGELLIKYGKNQRSSHFLILLANRPFAGDFQ